MTPREALRSATIDAAELLGADEEIGSIEAGKYADLVAVGSDPARDISALRSMHFVFKGGIRFRHR